MKSSGKMTILFTLVLTFLLLAAPAWATRPVAKVTSFTGEVLIVSGVDAMPVSHVGQFVNAGDKVQTKQGSVQITFTDGAVLRVRPFTSTMVQERQEESGFLFWKKKISVRRITNYVGKLWFKSGASDRRNFIQSTTAVCGLRGTIAESLVTLQQALIRFEEGSGDISGAMLLVEQALRESTQGEAANNPVYQKISVAAAKMQKAQETGKAIDVAAAKAEIADAGITAAEELDKNPALEPSAKELNQADKNAFITAKAAADAEVKVAELEEIKEAATEAGNQEAVEAAEQALEGIEDKVEDLQDQAEKALTVVTAEEPPTPEEIEQLEATAKLADTALVGILTTIDTTPGMEDAAKEFVPPSPTEPEPEAKPEPVPAPDPVPAPEPVVPTVDEPQPTFDPTEEGGDIPPGPGGSPAE